MQNKFQRAITFLATAVLLWGCENEPVPDATLVAGAAHSDVELSVAVGHAAPDFTATDANGDRVSLSDYRARQSVLLVFYRGGWCPFCVSHLDDIQSLFPVLDQHGVQLLAISPEDAEASAKLAKKFEQPYRFVSDSELVITDAYGIRRDEELPHPAVFLIDREGKIVWYYVGEDYKQRPSSSQLRQVIENHL